MPSRGRAAVRSSFSWWSWAARKVCSTRVRAIASHAPVAVASSIDGGRHRPVLGAHRLGQEASLGAALRLEEPAFVALQVWQELGTAELHQVGREPQGTPRAARGHPTSAVPRSSGRTGDGHGRRAGDRSGSHAATLAIDAQSASLPNGQLRGILASVTETSLREDQTTCHRPCPGAGRLRSRPRAWCRRLHHRRGGRAGRLLQADLRQPLRGQGGGHRRGRLRAGAGTRSTRPPTRTCRWSTGCRPWPDSS